MTMWACVQEASVGFMSSSGTAFARWDATSAESDSHKQAANDDGRLWSMMLVVAS